MVRRILYYQGLYDEKSVQEKIYELFKLAGKIKGLNQLYGLIDFSLDYYESNCFFPPPAVMEEKFHFPYDKSPFKGQEDFTLYLNEMLAKFRDEARKSCCLRYLNTVKVDARMTLLDELTGIERAIMVEEKELLEAGEVDIQAVYSNRKQLGVGPKTSIPDVDAIIGGVTAGKIMVVAAPPKCFKTMFAINFVYNCVTAYEESNNTLFITLELPKDELYYKLLVRHSTGMNKQLNIASILKGVLKGDEEKQLYDAHFDFNHVKKSSLFLLDQRDIEMKSIAGFQQQLTEYIEKHEIKTIVLDYIQLFRNFRVTGYGDVYQFLNDVTGTLRVLSILYNLRVVLLSQINREGIKKGESREGRLSLTALSEINELERSAYYVITLWTNDALKASGQCRYQLLAHRDGPTIEEPRLTYVRPECFMFTSGYMPVTEEELLINGDMEFSVLDHL